VRRVDQLQAAKFIRNVRKIHKVLRFSKTGRLRCDVATLRTPYVRL